MRNDIFEKHIERVGADKVHEDQLLPVKKKELRELSKNVTNRTPFMPMLDTGDKP